MARTRSMTRNRIYDNDGASSSSRKGPKTCAFWSDLDHDLLHLVMMQLGFVDYYSFRGVCKSWRSLACKNENMFMASMPPMFISISSDANERACYLEDFEGRRFKTILPHSVVGDCVGLTCGYLVFFTLSTRDFWLVNPITRKVLHFPNIPPFVYHQGTFDLCRVILVFSASISEWVLVVKRKFSASIRVSVMGKGAWNLLYHNDYIYDLCAFKGRIYVLTNNTPYHLCELRFTPQPKLMPLEIKKPDLFLPIEFVSSGENLYEMNRCTTGLTGLQELDLGEMKWVPCDCEDNIEEYAFLSRDLNHAGIAVKQELWADLLSWSLGRYASFNYTDRIGKIRFFTTKMWYFPHVSMIVDRIE